MIRGRKRTKVIAVLLCQLIVLGMFSTNVYAETISENPSEKVIDINKGDILHHNYGTVTINNGRVTYNSGTVTTNSSEGQAVECNYGTVTTNNSAVYENMNGGTVTTNNCIVSDNKDGGTVTTNNGTVRKNNGTVENNYGTVERNYGTVTGGTGTVENNYGTVIDGTVENNYGTVTNGTVTNNYGTVTGGTVTNKYCEITISGTNADKVYVVGIKDANNKKYVQIEPTSTTITLSPQTGYHFASAPSATGCTITKNENNYEISGVPDGTGVLDITLNIVKDSAPTPDPDPTPNVNNNSNNDGNDSDNSETVEAPSPYEIFLQSQIAKIKNAKAGDTIVIESDSYQSYSTVFMKELLERRDITIKMSYNYKGMHYEVVIPPKYKFVSDEKILWYGPLKLAEMFGAVITPNVQ